MSNWKLWEDDSHTINWQFGRVEQIGPFTYPMLRDGSDIILASDYSGEHAHPDFHVLGFLLTTYDSVMNQWEPLRSEVRKRYLSDGRRMSFKDLNDAQRINALHTFLEAASQLNGILVCVAVDKSYSFSLNKVKLPPLRHDWKPEALQKLLKICVFGGGFVDGLRGSGQNLHWITDDDAIVATENAQNDAMDLMGAYLHKYSDEYLQVQLGIASKFDDESRAEDIVAIPDLAAGAVSEMLTKIGKSNLRTSGSGPNRTPRFLQTKSNILNAWCSETGKPLKHFDVTIRVADGGRTHFSFGKPMVRLLRPDEQSDGSTTLTPKWERALEAEQKEASPTVVYLGADQH